VNPRTLRSEALLLLASIIWGFAFVAQRAAMDHLGPFLFNAVRFGIGALTLLPFALRGVKKAEIGAPTPGPGRIDLSWSAGVLGGLFLFGGASLQQAGMVTTTAGKAGFITALYVVLVPLLGLFVRHRRCRRLDRRRLRGDRPLLLVHSREPASFAAMCWCSARRSSGRCILLVGNVTPRIRLMTFACVQCATCAILCGAVAIAIEAVGLAALRQTAVPLLYAGVLSTGVAFTLQIVGQRATPPARGVIRH
jgi:drug/metabolite transporter (DMT)-like permease